MSEDTENLIVSMLPDATIQYIPIGYSRIAREYWVTFINLEGQLTTSGLVSAGFMRNVSSPGPTSGSGMWSYPTWWLGGYGGKMKEIHIGSNVTAIGSDVFRYLSTSEIGLMSNRKYSLRVVTIPNSV